MSVPGVPGVRESQSQEEYNCTRPRSPRSPRSPGVPGVPESPGPGVSTWVESPVSLPCLGMPLGERGTARAFGALVIYIMICVSSLSRAFRKGEFQRGPSLRSTLSSFLVKGDRIGCVGSFPRVYSQFSGSMSESGERDGRSHQQREVRERTTSHRVLSKELDKGGRDENVSGTDHLYGVSPVRAALIADKRKMEALLVQEGMKMDAKKDKKGAFEIMSLAKKKEIPIQEFSKHDLNMLSSNRPHQGFILRAHPLTFRKLAKSQALLPQSLEKDCSRSKVILALDEVWDPQNFGALLRTAHFLPGVAEVVVCAKNSAPLSETVSKASAGAMESMEVFSVDNMMKFLENSVLAGWQVAGASLGDGSALLSEIPKHRPTILVLGNEGHGIRKNVLRQCTHLVRIDGGQADGLDSLNVSVTGGILLHGLSS